MPSGFSRRDWRTLLPANADGRERCPSHHRFLEPAVLENSFSRDDELCHCSPWASYERCGWVCCVVCCDSGPIRLALTLSEISAKPRMFPVRCGVSYSQLGTNSHLPGP